MTNNLIGISTKNTLNVPFEGGKDISILFALPPTLQFEDYVTCHVSPQLAS